MKYSYPVCCPSTAEKIMAWCDSYKEAFHFLKQSGYEAVELLVNNPDDVDRTNLEQLLHENQLVLSAIGTTPMQKTDKLFLMDSDRSKQEEAIRRLDALLDLGAYFNAPVLIGKYRGMKENKAGSRMSDLNRIIAHADKRAASLGICLYLEPQRKDNINNLNTVGEMVQWIQKNHYTNIKLLMDIFHMYDTEESITESLCRYKEYIGMIHMSDSKRLVPGFGDANIRSVMKALKSIGYRGYLSMEIKQQPATKLVAALSVLSLNYLSEEE